MRKALVLRRNILTEILFAQLLQGAVGTQLVDGGVDGIQQGGAGIALAQRNGNVGCILGLGHQLEICVRVDVQVIVEGDIGVQGGVDAACGEQLDGLFQRVDALYGGTTVALPFRSSKLVISSLSLRTARAVWM